MMHVAVDHYACDLCPRYRPRERRVVGIDWIDCFWACESCMRAYYADLMVAGGRSKKKCLA
jgi:hypothetical protein